jgi:predicted transposase/invertase (TIGR01784 family)
VLRREGAGPNPKKAEFEDDQTNGGRDKKRLREQLTATAAETGAMTRPLDKSDFLDQQNDLVFKLLLQRHEPLLRSMLEAVLAEPVAAFTVLNPEIPGDLPGHKSIIVDILVRLADGRRVNVEMQVNSRPELRRRLAYYLARNLSDQLVRGDNYALVCPSILVAWLAEPLFRELEQFHSIFELRERSTHVAFGPELTMHVLQLSKLKTGAPASTGQNSTYAELERLWGRFFTAKTHLDFVQLRAQHPIMSQAVDALEELSQDPEVRRLAEKRRVDLIFYEMGLKMARDEATKQGWDEGLERGLQQGLEQGREQGLEQGREQGLQQGLEQGREQGREEGQTAGQVAMLLRLMELKFGVAPAELTARVRAASQHDLTRWSERLFQAATLTDVFGE